MKVWKLSHRHRRAGRVVTPSLLLVGLLALTHAVAVAAAPASVQPRRLFPCQRTDYSVAVDGKLEEWRGQPSLLLCTGEQAGFAPEWRGPSDLSARGRALWNETFLSLAVEVCDDAVASTGDGVELSVAGRRFFVAADASQRRLVRTIDPATSVPQPGTRIWVEVTPKGYLVEGQIACYAVPLGAPEIGTQLHFNVTVRDVEFSAGPVETVMSWCSSDNGRLVTIDQLTESNLRFFVGGLTTLGLNRPYFLQSEAGEFTCWSGIPPTFGLTPCAIALKGEETSSPVTERLPDVVETLASAPRWKFSSPNVKSGIFDVEAAWGTPSGRTIAAVSTGGRVLSQEYGEVKASYEALKQSLEKLAASSVRTSGPAATVLWNSQQIAGSLGGIPGGSRPDLAGLRTQVSELQQQLRLLEAGSDPFADKRGVLVKAYWSEIDDTLQPYSVYVPTSYRPGTPIPMIVRLHGYGGNYSLGAPSGPTAEILNVAPQGRGNTDYKAWGEGDVLRVVQEVKDSYTVDDNRVYLSGSSMGGTGTWQLGVHYPDLFAAIAPLCGNADHRVWEEEWGWGEKERTWLSAEKDFIESTESNAFLAENLLNVPVYCVHGTADKTVPVGHSRSMAARLEELRYPIIYDEQEGAGHGGFRAGTDQLIDDFLLSHVRNPYPKRVVYKTAWLRYPGAYWVKIDRFERALEFAQIEAEIVSPTEIKVTTENVARFTLTLAEELVDPAKPVRVRIDRRASFGILPKERNQVTFFRSQSGLWQVGKLPEGLCKNNVLEGPVEHAFFSRFLLVYGTASPDPKETDLNKREAQRFEEWWRRWANGPCRIKADTEVTDQDLRDSNLVLYGGPRSNALTARVNRYLPVRFFGKSITLGDKTFAGDDVGVKMVYPNPLNPDRYVVVFAGTTSQATFDINGRFGNWFSWGVFDNRNWFDFAVFDSRTVDTETFCAVGFFNQDWQLDPATTWWGDRERRSMAPVKLLPQRGAADATDGFAYLSDLSPVTTNFEKGVLGVDRSFEGRSLTLGDTVFKKGLGVHPNAEVIYDLGGRFRTFEAWVGIDLEGAESVASARAEAERVEFSVYGDNQLLARVSDVRWDTKPVPVYLSIAGVNQLKLVTTRLDDRRWLFGDCDWADAKVGQKWPTPSPDALLGPIEPWGELAESRTLDAGWKLLNFEVGEGAEQGVYKPDWTPASSSRSSYDYYSYSSAPTVEALEVSVPSVVQDELIRKGKLDDPYVDDFYERDSWVHQKEWWYTRAFDVPESWRGRHVWLALDGASYAAEVWVNGLSVATVVGAGNPARVDISRAVRFGDSNFVAVRVTGGLASWTHSPAPVAVPRLEEVVGFRQSFGGEGWPAMGPIGLYQSVRVETTGAVDLLGATVSTLKLSEKSASLRVCARLSNVTDRPQTITLVGSIKAPAVAKAPEAGPAPEGSKARNFSHQVLLEPDKVSDVSTDLELESPQLWWPRSLGGRAVPAAPPLYELVLAATLEGGAVSDKCSTTFGVRTFEVDTRDGRWTVNGKPWDMVSAKWVAPDLLLRLPAARYRCLLNRARESGVGLLRVPADSFPESESLLQACDELGLVVVIGLPMPKASFNALTREVYRSSVIESVLRCSSHPSRSFFSTEARDLAEADKSQWDRITAELKGRNCPDIVEASALTRTLTTPMGGYTVAPVAETIERVLSEKGRQPAGPAWQAHASKGAKDSPQARLFGALADWRKFSQAGQLLAAEAAWSVADKSATDLGLLADPWPSISTSLSDWFGLGKPSAYFARRALGPPALAVHGPKDTWTAGERFSAEIRVVSRAEVALPDGTVLSLRLFDSDGTTLAEAKQPIPGGRGSTDRSPQFAIRKEIPRYASHELLFLLSRLTDKQGAILAEDLRWYAVRPAQRNSQQLHVLWVGRGDSPALGSLSASGVHVTVAPSEADKPLLLRTPSVGQQPPLEPPDAIIVETDGNWASGPAKRLALEVVQAVEQGAGIILSGVPAKSSAFWQTSLARLMPARVAPTRHPGDSTLTASSRDHPAVLGLDWATVPAWHEAPAVSAKPGTEVLLRAGEDLPVLVEGQQRAGRVLLFAPGLSGEWARSVAACWPDSDRFVMGMVGYVAKLSHPQMEQLKHTAPPPFARLLDLQQTTLTASAETQEAIVPAGQEIKTIVTVRNTGKRFAFMVSVHCRDLPSLTLAGVSDNFFQLLPGEERKVVVTLTHPGWPVSPGPAKLSVSAWNAEDVALPLTVWFGEKRAEPPPVAPSERVPTPETGPEWWNVPGPGGAPRRGYPTYPTGPFAPMQ